LNILILGNCTEDFYNYLKTSKLFDKMFLAGNSAESNIPNIDFEDEKELTNKIKALQIDVVLVTDKTFIKNGYVDFLKSHYINVISPNKKWFNLEFSQAVSKKLLEYYSINTPKIILAPKEFPLVIRTNSSNKRKIAKNMDELIDLMKNLSSEQYFLEEYLDGNCQSLLSLWDGESLYHFDSEINLTEVQKDRLDLLKTKFNFMFGDEKPNFIGFFSSELIWAKNDWHVISFEMGLNENLIIKNIKKDFLYILNSAIYQKLNELK